jgi:hypothetical protein
VRNARGVARFANMRCIIMPNEIAKDWISFDKPWKVVAVVDSRIHRQLSPLASLSPTREEVDGAAVICRQ